MAKECQTLVEVNSELCAMERAIEALNARLDQLTTSYNELATQFNEVVTKPADATKAAAKTK